MSRVLAVENGRFWKLGAVVVGLVLAGASPFAVPAAGQAKPARGDFLIAGPRLIDPNFTQTVVLLTDAGPHGTMGLVINRPTDVSISHAMPELSDLSRSAEKVFIGGPVRPDELFVLVRSDGEPTQSHHVFDDVYLSGSHDLLKELLGGDETFRVFAGYAGWGPGQLDTEIARGDWFVRPADADSIFDDERLRRHRAPPDPAWSADLRLSGPLGR